jgi:hypothetical protein
MQDYMEGDDDGFSYNINFNQQGMRMFYDHLCYSIEVWPGSPRRPVDEQNMLQQLKMQVFTSLLENNFENYGTTN